MQIKTMLPSTDSISKSPSTTHTANNSIGMLALIDSAVGETLVAEVIVDTVGSTVDGVMMDVASHLST